MVKLVNSANVALAGGVVKYYDGSWHPVGNTNASGLMAFGFPGTSTNLLFSVDYAFTHNEKWQNIATNPIVLFQTKKVEGAP